jgi:dTDP-4-dehydrorhamnose 3,5-epimerase-like enzyme
MKHISDIRRIDLPAYRREDGEVVVAQTTESVPFNIARMFALRAPTGAERGKHAHRRCTQLMVCLNGLVDIVCDDGRDKSTYTLDRSDAALLVPPTIWNTVVFRAEQSVLVVLCDRPFEEDDYLRTYEEFMAYRKAAHP